MRKLYLLLALFLFPLVGHAQQLTINAVVTDPNGRPYASGTSHASLVCTGNSQAYFNNSPIARDTPTVGLDGFGGFSQVVYDLSQLTDVNHAPLACGYVFRITESCGVANFSTGSITGIVGPGPVNLSSQISSFAVPLSAQCVPGGGGIRIEANGTSFPVEPILNFINGTGSTASCANNVGNTSTDCTFNVTNITCTTAQILFGTGATTAGCDPNLSWDNTKKIVNIGPLTARTLKEKSALLAGSGILPPPGDQVGSGIIQIEPGLDFTDNGGAVPFSTASGESINLSSGIDGAAAASNESIYTHYDSCTSTNGSLCVGVHNTMNVDDSSGLNGSGNKLAEGFEATTDASVTGGTGRSVGIVTVDTCSGSVTFPCTSVGGDFEPSCNGASCSSTAGYFDSTCTGAGCGAHVLNLNRGDIALTGDPGILGQTIISQGPNAIPIWGKPAGPLLKTNGVTNGSQTILNLAAGSNITITDGGTGTVTIAGTGGGGATTPGGSSGQIQYNNAGAFGGFTMAGDCTLSQPNITCTKTGGVAFAASATTDTTNASNISSGTLAGARMSAVNLAAAGNGGVTGLLPVASMNFNGSIICATVNTCALGSAPIPMTNLFIGTVANRAASTDSSSLTANRSIKLVDAAMVIPQPLTVASHLFLTGLSSTTGLLSAIQPTLADIAAGVAPAGLFDYSLGTFKLPVAAGFVTTANGNAGYDTTNKNWHLWDNGADRIAGVFDGTQVNNDCLIAKIASSVVNLSDGGVCVTATSTATLTNKTYNAESTGNNLSIPTIYSFKAAGCSNSSAGPILDLGTTNVPTVQCAGTTVPKGVLQFAHGNVAYFSDSLPKDLNTSASLDIELCFTTTDNVNGHITTWNIQTGFNKTDGTATDDPSLNTLQPLSVTIGATQIPGGEVCGTLTGLTTTGWNPDYNFEIVIARSGSDTNTDAAVSLKNGKLIFGRTMNAANR